MSLNINILHNRILRVSLLSIAFLLFAPSGYTQAPRADEFHVPYEMAVYKGKESPQDAGTHLNGPGDNYRYTYFIDDKYSKDLDYTLSRAIIGVHIIDTDFTDIEGDKYAEWGRILFNGKPLKWIHFNDFIGFRENEEATSSALYEMKSDKEVGGLPPYIFDVTKMLNDQRSDNRKLVLDIINMREDGSIDSDAKFGDFTVLRAGLHLYYVKTTLNPR